MPSSSAAMTTLAPSLGDVRRIEQYGKIVAFRERVLSGKHPTIKVPAHLLAAKQSPAPAPTTSPSHQPQPDVDRVAAENRKAFQANSTRPPLVASLPGPGPLPPNGHALVSTASSTPASAKTFGSARAELDPIFLEKSDHLIKTEIQLQRQRVERALREQVEQRRNTLSTLQPSEPLPDFNLMDVLKKSMALVKQTAPSLADANVAANKSDESGSVDGRASRVHDTPNSAHLARLPTESEPEDLEMRDSPDYEPELDFDSGPEVAGPVAAATTSAHGAVGGYTRPNAPEYRVAEKARDSAQRPPSPRIQYSTLGGTNTVVQGAANPLHLGQALHIVSSGESADASGSAESGNTDNEQSTYDRPFRLAVPPGLGNALDGRGATVVRAHDLSPLAPQPSHVSPLVTSGNPQPPALEDQLVRGTPAQVAAIRNEVSIASSPESSPQAAKGTEKRKGKKKAKRKADRQVDTAPYIKAEPRSLSPTSAMPAIRPHKRLRQSQRSMDQLEYDEPRHTNARADSHKDYHRAPVHGDDAPRVAYQRRDDPIHDDAPVVMSTSQRYDPDVYEVRRPHISPHPTHVHEPTGLYPTQYGADPRIRSASHTVLERPVYREAPVYYRDEPRMSVRPGANQDRSRSPVMREARPATMAPPPRSQPTRVFIDEYGREYLEPPRVPTVVRQPLGPPSLPGETIIYDHPVPTRTASRANDPYGDNIVYRRASPHVFAAPRRVITEPEYINGDPRQYRQREYSVVRTGPAAIEEYVQSRPPPERRVVEDVPREFISRSASVRPAEPVRYEMVGGYGERFGSVRPEIPLREYAASVHPEARREVIYQPAVAREYSVRPEAPVIQRPFRPVESQAVSYERPVRAVEDVGYIDRSRGGIDGPVYEEAPRRDVYR